MISLRYLWALLLAVLAVRLISLGFYPLMDTSEARYAEMARKMIELQDWITPMFDYGQPFWGKPPLSFWTQAASMQLFGVNEWAVRLPSFVFLCLSCGLIYHFVRQAYNQATALLAALIYASSAIGFILGGAVLTDPALAFSVLLSFYGFWFAIQAKGRGYGYLCFFGLSLGMLAKGPLALVLFGVPAVLYLSLFGLWRSLRYLPWLGGMALFLLVSVPWFLLAENKTPGFLQYFFVGEHWNRYMVSGWKGDLYGNAHARHMGAIWLDLLVSMFPWVLLLPIILWHGKKAEKQPAARGFESYLLIWALFLPVFFSLSKNILWTYVMPSMPALAMWLAIRVYNSIALKTWQLLCFSLLLPIGLSLLIADGRAFSKWKNQKQTVASWTQQEQKADLWVYQRRIYSAEFYSAGKAKTTNEQGLAKIPRPFYLAVRKRDQVSYLAMGLSNCRLVSEENKTQLYFCTKA